MTYNILIEIPLNSRVKYEFNKKFNTIMVDRYLKTPLPYPFNYGYFPNTLAEDNDPLDAILLINQELVPGCLIECEIVGGIEMIDNGEIDHKIFVFPKKELNFPENNMYKDGKITKSFYEEIRFFLENYKKMENKKVSLGKMISKEEAIELYNKFKL